MKKIALPIIMIALLATSCDTIEPDANGNYTTYAGPQISWTDGTALSDHSHKALVEKYTGPRCSNCPVADQALELAHEQVGDRLVLVSITHPDEEPLGASLDTRTDDGSTWARFFGVSFRPTAMLNRTNNDGQWDLFTGSPAISGMTPAIESANAQTPLVALDCHATQQGDSTDITLNLELLDAVDYPLNITIVTTEDSLAYPQLTNSTPISDYRHNHILRQVVTDLWGNTVTTSAPAGKTYQGRIKVVLRSIQDLQNAHIVAFATNANTRQVLNAAQCSIE
ncbi:MAG: Omp28-related outer membrane protein [Bacteroidales bacterium]|nr:Omp28-related outer membrane protein [Bacteroidales bacterium]